MGQVIDKHIISGLCNTKDSLGQFSHFTPGIRPLLLDTTKQ
jgi:hypothetical protein